MILPCCPIRLTDFGVLFYRNGDRRWRIECSSPLLPAWVADWQLEYEELNRLSQNLRTQVEMKYLSRNV